MQKKLTTLTGFIYLIAAITLCPISYAATEPENNETILILDGSGSMWGQIDGVTKIEIAREVVGNVIADWNPEHHLGLMAYGHREKGDCNDIEILIPVGSPNLAEFNKHLQKVTPTGKTPLSAAVKQAANELNFTAKKATVILVSDGRETCNLDPCTVADELEKAGIDFTAHVVGFDIEAEQDVAQLQCLAERTGGRYLAAKDASTLAKAMTDVVEEVRADSILFVAALEKGGERLTKGVNWTITETTADFEGNYKKIIASGAPQAKFKLDNGTYRVVTHRGATLVASTVIIDDATQLVEVVLGAGDLALRAVMHEGGEPITKGVNWAIYESELGFDGNKKKVTATGASQKTFTLPAGEYRVTATKGSASATEILQVQGGEQTVAIVSLNAADVLAVAVLADGGEIIERGVNWQVTETEPGFDGQYKKIVGTGASKAAFTLPMGSYRLVAQKGAASAEQLITLDAGQQIKHSVPLNAGDIRVTASLAEGEDPLTKGVNWAVYSTTPEADGSFKKVVATGASQTVFTLPAGQYRLQARRDAAAAEKVIEVTAGTQRHEPLSLNAGVVMAIATNGEGGAEINRGLNWTVLDETDPDNTKKVRSTGATKPTFTLPAGTYRLQVNQRRPDVSAESMVTVTSGASAKVRVPLAMPTVSNN